MVSARTTRQNRVQSMMAIAAMTDPTPAPRTATRRIESRTGGNAIQMSTNREGSGANSRRRKASRVVLSRLQAWSTAFHTAGASRSWTPRRPSPNCPLRMRCINSIPGIVIAAVAKPLKPSIVAIRCFTPRWSCSIRLFKYFDDRNFVSAAASHRLSAHGPRGETRHSRPE
jgi:hypothetical protein